MLRYTYSMLFCFGLIVTIAFGLVASNLSLATQMHAEVSSVEPPASHAYLVNRIRITTVFPDDLGGIFDYEFAKTCVFVGWEPEMPPPQYGADLPQSLWLFHHRTTEVRGGRALFYDAGVALKIWGPFPKGSYMLFFCRLGEGTVKVYFDGQMIKEFEWFETSMFTYNLAG